MYKEASKKGLRFQTTVGMLSVEQLWTLSVNQLDALAVSLESEYKESGKKSFLVKRSVKDKTTKLKFSIVLDILETKVDEASTAKNTAENKAHNQKILSLIADKQNDELRGKSIKELERELR